MGQARVQLRRLESQVVFSLYCLLLALSECPPWRLIRIARWSKKQLVRRLRGLAYRGIIFGSFRRGTSLWCRLEWAAGRGGRLRSIKR